MMIDLDTSARENFIERLKHINTASELRRALDTGDLPVHDVKKLVSGLRPVQHRNLLALWLGLDGERVPTFSILAERLSMQPSSLSKMVSAACTIMLAHLRSENPKYNPFINTATSNPSIDTLVAELDLAGLQTRAPVRIAHSAAWAIQIKLAPVKKATGKTWAEIYCDELCRYQVSDFDNFKVFGVGPSVMKLLAEVLAVFGRQLGDRARDKPAVSAPEVIVVPSRKFDAHPRSKNGNRLSKPKSSLILPPLFEGFYQAVWRGCAERERFEANFQAVIWGRNSFRRMLRGDDLVQVACLFAQQVIRLHSNKLDVILRQHPKTSGVLQATDNLMLNAEPAKLSWSKCWADTARQITEAAIGRTRALSDKRLQAFVFLCLGIVAQFSSRPLWAEPISLSGSVYTTRADEERSARLHKYFHVSTEHGENFIRLLVEAALEDSYGVARPSRGLAVQQSTSSLYSHLAEQMLRTLNEYQKETA